MNIIKWIKSIFGESEFKLLNGNKIENKKNINNYSVGENQYNINQYSAKPEAIPALTLVFIVSQDVDEEQMELQISAYLSSFFVYTLEDESKNGLHEVRVNIPVNTTNINERSKIADEYIQQVMQKFKNELIQARKEI